MGAIVATDPRRSQVQSPDDQRTLPLKTLVKGPNDVQSADGDWILTLLHEAYDITYPAGERTKAAYGMGYDPSLLNRLWDGDGKLDVRKIGTLGERYWLNVHALLGRRFNMEDDEQRLRRALDARRVCDQVIEELARKGVTR